MRNWGQCACVELQQLSNVLVVGQLVIPVGVLTQRARARAGHPAAALDPHILLGA